MKTFAAALLKSDNNENSFNTNKWTVILENFIEFAEYYSNENNEAKQEDRYKSIYKYNDDENYEHDITLISNINTTNNSKYVEYQSHNSILTKNLNEGQNEIISIYNYYFNEETVYKIQTKVSNIVLITEIGRTGKSYNVIHRLLQIGNQNKTQNGINIEINSIQTIANKNPNSVDIDGSNIATLFYLRIEKITNESDKYLVLLIQISQ